LYRWHWQIAAEPRVPNTLWRSWQLAWLAATIVIEGDSAASDTAHAVERIGLVAAAAGV
jgi:hypothetical protein